MKTMFKNKLALALMPFMMIVSQASAEESGGFIGFGLGLNLSDYQMKLSPCSLNNCALGTVSNMTFDNSKQVGVSLSLIAGYKQMFNDYFGLRYYANFDYSHANFKTNAKVWNGGGDLQQEYNDKPSGYTLSLGANIDVLANFIVNPEWSFGAFIGLNMGLRHWGGEISNYHNAFIDNQYWIEYGDYSKKNLNFFDIGLNLGLRGNIFNHHDIELFTRIPFLQDSIMKSKSTPFDADFIVKQDFILGLRYAYVF